MHLSGGMYVTGMRTPGSGLGDGYPTDRARAARPLLAWVAKL